MAKRKSEEVEDVRSVFVSTSLNTNIVLVVSPTDTVSLLKQNILLEHPKLFPDFGEIQINALKVKRRENYYHLVDSMFVKPVFYTVADNWFLFADVSSQITGPSKTLLILDTSSKQLESGINCNEVDRYRNYSDVNNGLGLQMANKIVPGVHDEFKYAEEALNPENLGSGNKKNVKNKRRRNKKRRRKHNGNGQENGERPEDLHLDHAGKGGMKSATLVADKVSPSTRAKKNHKVLNNYVEDVQEGTQSHYQPEGTRTSSDNLVNTEIENDDVELAPGFRAKKTKKSEKSDKMPDFPENDNDKADRDDGTHLIDNKINRVKTVCIFSPDGDQEAREIGAEPLQTAEINKPSVSLEVRPEKTKQKTQKKQTVSMKDSPDFSVIERSGEKTTDADTLKADDVNILVDGDLYKDTNKTPLPEICVNVAEARNTKPHASKNKVKNLVSYMNQKDKNLLLGTTNQEFDSFTSI